jgi:type I restriction enzyme R subunit
VRYADYVVSGMGAEDSVDGMTKIKRFKKETFPQILVSVNMLDTGFDCPEVVSLVFARFTKSAILYQQMRGRGTRKAKGKGVFTMFDFVGVTDYHGDDDDDIQGGAIVSGKPPRPPGPPRVLLSLDIDDQIGPTTREWVTTDENGNMVFPEASAQKQGEIGAKFEAWLLSQGDVTPDQSRWLGLVGGQLRANADTWNEFTSDHFAFHPFTSLGGRPEAIRVFGGLDPLEAVLDSMSRAVFGPNDKSSNQDESRQGFSS